MAKKSDQQNSKVEENQLHTEPIDTNHNTCSYCYNTPKQLAEDPAFCFSLASLRYHILHAHKNGLASAIRRVGKKLVIRRDLFIDWLEKQSR